MEKFIEIEKAKLENISTTTATYVAASGDSEPKLVDGCTLKFDCGIFVIENKFEIKDKNNNEIDINALIGLTVNTAYSTDLEIKVIFENDSYISVSMKNEDFISPEAASYSPNNGDIIVFN